MWGNPWKEEDCLRKDCTLCEARRQGDETVSGSCKSKSITYQTICKLCKDQGKETIYVGGSGRSIFERGKEHVKNSLSQKAKSHIREHIETDHPGQEPEIGSFKFSITGTYHSALDRQLAEAIKIRRAQNTRAKVLNSKFEFNRCVIPAIVVQDPRIQVKKKNPNKDTEPEEGDAEEGWQTQAKGQEIQPQEKKTPRKKLKYPQRK